MAGFHVTGVDINPQPRYAGDAFIQADAMTFPLDGFDVIHASPPCQQYTVINKSLWRMQYDDLVEQVSARLWTHGVPYVIENVAGAPLQSPLMLCGSMFGLKVIRHRFFESNVLLFAPGVCRHNGSVKSGEYVTVTGHGGGVHGHPRMWPSAMGIVWMKKHELAQAIPPAYTYWLGTQLMAALERGAA